MTNIIGQAHLRTIITCMCLTIVCAAAELSAAEVPLVEGSADLYAGPLPKTTWHMPTHKAPGPPDYLPEGLYPLREKREKSPGNTTYYVDLADGNDSADGKSEKTAWKSFVPVNNRIFTKGDQIHVIKPGSIHETIMPMTDGTDGKSPLIIRFAPGRYDVFREKLAKRKFHISNTNNDPYGLKAMAIYIYKTEGVALEGKDSIFFMRGQMIEACVDHSQDVSFKGLSFDYHRPTVSEYRVVKIENGMVDIEIHKDSLYEVKDNRLYWLGDGWRQRNWFYLQQLSDDDDVVRRGKNNPLGYTETVEELKPFVVRIPQKNKLPKIVNLETGVTYQTADRFRNCVGVLHQYSKNIIWENCNFHFFHGMGVISQFTENITFQNVTIAPRKESGRTCAAYADLLHYSGCRGQINVFNVHFSGAMDDAINVHGTYLRVTERMSDHKIKVRYMHHETYGFMQYFKGDEIEFFRVRTALPYAANTVEEVVQLDERTFELTLKDKVPQDIEQNDVIENVTWTAAVHVKDCVVERIPTRGFLIGTRKKVLIEDTVFKSPGMGIGVLVEGSLRGWYESGAIRDMTIRNCTFYNCSINIETEASEVGDQGVHQNIRIVDNTFIGGNVVTARFVENMTITGNSIPGQIERLVKSEKSKNVVIKDNVIKPDAAE